jgi:hypothetical protein
MYAPDTGPRAARRYLAARRLEREAERTAALDELLVAGALVCSTAWILHCAGWLVLP